MTEAELRGLGKTQRHALSKLEKIGSWIPQTAHMRKVLDSLVKRGLVIVMVSEVDGVAVYQLTPRVS